MKNITSLCFVIIFCALNAFGQTTAPTPAPVTPATTDGTGGNMLVSPQPPAASSAEPQPPVTKTNVERPATPYARKDAPVRIPRFETPPVIDGQLSDEVWRSAALFGDFVQTNP